MKKAGGKKEAQKQALSEAVVKQQDYVGLDQLKPGDYGRIAGFKEECKVRKRLRDMGIIAGCKIECIGISPLGDPSAYWVKGTALAIRSSDAEGIIIKSIEIRE